MRVVFAAIARLALCAVPAVTLVNTASAQNEPLAQENIDTITVTATRLGQTATETGSSLSIITAEEIEELGLIYVLDAVAQAPGVTINQNGTFGGTASVRCWRTRSTRPSC